MPYLTLPAMASCATFYSVSPCPGKPCLPGSRPREREPLSQLFVQDYAHSSRLKIRLATSRIPKSEKASKKRESRFHSMDLFFTLIKLSAGAPLPQAQCNHATRSRLSGLY